MKNLTLSVTLLVLLGSLDVCHPARILGIFPLKGRSHYIVLSSLAKELARRGHQLTVINPFPQKPPLANYTDIVIEDFIPKEEFGNLFDFGNLSPALMMLAMWVFGPDMCAGQINQPPVLDLINSKEQQFDLVIVEAFFQECFLGFAHKFKAPLISFGVFGGGPWMDDMVGNPTPYSYVPHPFLDYGANMTFFQRLTNTVLGLLTSIGRHLYYMPKQDAVMRKYFNDSTLPYIEDLERNTSILLVNNHFILSQPRPLVPNLISVGGLHIKPPGKLSHDLQKFLDSATDGVIYFSMGSNLKSADLPKEKRDALLNSFAKLKQKVLWKWEEDSLPGQPKNVHLGKWLPQPDILAHKNVRIFITHGGLMSTQEAVYHGIPVIGIPVYGDQELNMAHAEATGFGIRLSYSKLTEQAISWAINEILSKSSYKENARHLSNIFRDNPQSPMETAVYWTEYVIRHQGAPHLRSAAMNLTWYQYFLLDVLAVLLGAVIIVLLVTGFILRALYRRLFSAAVKKSAKKSKKRD